MRARFVQEIGWMFREGLNTTLYPILYSKTNSWIFANLGRLVEQIVLLSFRVRLVGPE